MDLSMLMTNWVWTPEWTPEDDADVHIVYFRKEFQVNEKEDSHIIRISADARYKLYINGTFAQKGPQKAMDTKEWFVDQVEIAPYLQEGDNVIAVEVIRFPECNFSSAMPKSNDSLYRSPIPNLFVTDVTALSAGGEAAYSLDAKKGWKCSINREIKIVGENTRPAPIHAQEDVTATNCYQGWKEIGYDASNWADVSTKLIFDVCMQDAPANQVERTIPFMKNEDKNFVEVMCLRDGEAVDESPEAAEAKDIWNQMLAQKGIVTIPAHSDVVVEVSSGVEECGFLEYAFAGGKGAAIETLCSECYAYPNPNASANPMAPPAAPIKGDRTDYKNGQLFGHTSVYHAAGYGTPEAPEVYEPYWFRTFRYIQLHITTEEEPLTITNFSYRKTGYPLDVKTSWTSSDETFAPIWDISVRTLELCMHETYFDCPFYEQLQYGMDSRSEILYTYATSGDDRLARQAMEAFRRSQRPDGMTNSDAPTVKSNVIPGFSIYYLMMVYDHMMYFGDKELVGDHMGAIDQILHFFHKNLGANGLVSKIGGPIMRAKFWSFIDWSKMWGNNGGVPDATNKGTGSLTMESLLYVYGLQHAAKLAAFIGRDGIAAEYEQRAAQVTEAIRANCMGEYVDAAGKSHTMLQDGPGIDDFSVHCQVFGILTDVLSVEEGREMLLTAIHEENLPQASVSFMFYLFRALEKAGMYEEADHYWNLWRQMVTDNMSTCVENDTDGRSDCHAWASLICYEMPSVYLGVRPAAPGYEKVSIEPMMGHLTSASGDVITPKGMVHVDWKKEEDGTMDLEYQVPEGMEVI